MVKLIISKLGASLAVLFLFPIFSVMTVVLPLCTVFLIAVALLRTFGVNIGMNLLFVEVPVFLSLPVALLFAAAFLYLAYWCWVMLKKTCRFAVSTFQKI